MTLIERIENFTQLWAMILPDLPVPSASSVSRWCVYPDRAIEQGIIRAGKKFAPNRIGDTNPDPEQVAKYVCGVAASEAKTISRTT